jgi:hypothetical protein
VERPNAHRRLRLLRRLPAALRKRPRWATAGEGAGAEVVGEEAEAEGGQWLGMWPILARCRRRQNP